MSVLGFWGALALFLLFVVVVAIKIFSYMHWHTSH